MIRPHMPVAACALLVAALAAWTGCGDDDSGGTGPQGVGSLEVILVMSGESLDADGCLFMVDGASQRRLLAGESTTYTGLSVGQHEVSISDVSGNCSTQGETTRSVSVVRNQTATVTFALLCLQGAGSIEITTETSGEDLDPDGYQYTLVEGGPLGEIGINDSRRVGGLPPGEFKVELLDVAANCSVDGGNPRFVTVAAEQTTHVVFAVTCHQVAGSLAISTTTSGEDQDEDGYEVVVDGGTPSVIGANGSITAGGLSPGNHTVELMEEAFNCFVQGNNPRTVTVVGGTETPVDFDVACRFHLYDRIAFRSYRSGSGAIYAIDPHDPGPPRALGLTGFDQVVSPDGLRIAYDFNTDIWVANSDGSDAVRLTESTDNELHPAWSADGSRIAYDRDVGPVREIWTMNADGSNQTSLGVEGWRPTWSPDGNQIAFANEVANNWDIWVVNSDGTGLYRLTTDPAFDGNPAWSPLGNYIAFESERNGTHIFLIEPTGGPATNMTIGLVPWARDAAWAPEAAAGAFSVDDGSNMDVYYFDPNVPQLVRLTTDAAVDCCPSWGGGN